MAIKQVTVSKNNVTKKIDADLEKDYVKNGWKVQNESPFGTTPYQYNVKK